MRRTNEQVTRDLSVEVVDLLLEAKISPHTLANLLGIRDSVLTYWFVRGVRPPLLVMREAKKVLKKVIALSRTSDFDEVIRNDAGQLRRVLNEWEDEPNAQAT